MPLDLYDPEEIRRRRMLIPGVDIALAQDPEDAYSGLEEEGIPDSQTMSKTPTLSTSQQNYRRALEAMPKPEGYQPSRGRRIGAIVAGALAGASGGAKTGYEVGRRIVSEPYDTAMSNWQNEIKREYESARVDDMASRQDIARRRAGAYQTSAEARMKAANATEAWRQYQQANMPYEPRTREEAESMLRLKHPPPEPRRPTAFEEYQQNPESYGKFQNLKPKTSMTFEERMQMERLREQGRNSRHAQTVARERQQVPSTPMQQQQAEDSAAIQLSRTNPEYTEFIVLPQAKGERLRIKTLEELPKPGMFSGVTPAQASLARERYRQFLSDLDRKKREILGSKAPESQWQIEKED